jgi:hypothetical protein
MKVARHFSGGSGGSQNLVPLGTAEDILVANRCSVVPAALCPAFRDSPPVNWRAILTQSLRDRASRTRTSLAQPGRRNSIFRPTAPAKGSISTRARFVSGHAFRGAEPGSPESGFSRWVTRPRPTQANRRLEWATSPSLLLRPGALHVSGRHRAKIRPTAVIGVVLPTLPRSACGGVAVRQFRTGGSCTAAPCS